MGLFTTTDDKYLEEARRHVTSSETICPGCKAPLSISGATLTSFNAALGIEAHTCPACGQVISRRNAGAGRL